MSNLHVTIGDKPILNGLTLDALEGEVHVVMGPDGADWCGPCYAGDRRSS